VSEALLVAAGVSKWYPQPGRRGRRRAVLDGVDLAVGAGERVAVVGASGAGKSTLLRLLLAIETPDAGTISFRGRRVLPDRPSRLRWFRREVQFVAQDPYGSLSPRMTVAEIVREPLRCLDVPGDHARRVAELLAAVHLDPALADRRSTELSGGQRQRVAVARALAPRPAVLVTDEPVSALDASVLVTVLDLLREVSAGTGAALVLVAHHLAAVRRACTRVVVLDNGRVVETGPVDEVFRTPRTPVTRALLDAVPRLPPSFRTTGGDP
jgi:peptide/nickel transport system ATP-binding protein